MVQFSSTDEVFGDLAEILVEKVDPKVLNQGDAAS